MAAANGVEAALFAKAGLISNPDALEVEHGFARNTTQDPVATALNELGKYWMLKKFAQISCLLPWTTSSA